MGLLAPVNVGFLPPIGDRTPVCCTDRTVPHHWAHQGSPSATIFITDVEKVVFPRTGPGASPSRLRSVTRLVPSSQFSSVAHSCPTLCDPMDRSTPGLPVHHQLLESTQTHVHRVGNTIQPPHPLSSPSLPTFNLSQHQGLFQRAGASQQAAKGLALQQVYPLFIGFPSH